MLRAVIGRPISVAIATVALVVVGGFSLLRLPVSLLPTLERPRLVVAVADADRSREELVRTVVEPLERRLRSLPGVLALRATVSDGECRLELDSEWQTDVDRLRIDAERRLAEVVALDLDRLEVSVEAGDREPILEVAVLGGASAHARTVFADEVLLPELGRLPGAGRLRRLGGALRRPVVRPRGAALAARGLTAAELAARLEEVGAGRPLGRLRDGAVVRPLVLREPVTSLAELAAVRLGPEGGTAVGEVAEVTFEEVPDGGLLRWNGEPGVLVELHRAPGANAVLLAREARRRLGALAGRAEGGLQLRVVRDRSREVTGALGQLAVAGLLGLALGTVVLRSLLGSWRPTLALLAVVPASIVTAFGGFYLFGVSLDVVSLAGLALAAGMLVDGAVVVLESIEVARHRAAEGGGDGDGGDDGDDPVIRGTRRVALPLLAGFLTTAVVFLPLIYLRGLARAFFGVQAFAIVTTLAVSLALSLTLVPVLARRLTRGGRPAAGRSPGRETYLRLLRRALDRPAAVVAAALLLLAVAAALLPALPRELMPEGPSRALRLEYRLPPGTSVEAAAERVVALEGAVGGGASDRSDRSDGSDRSDRSDKSDNRQLETISIYRGPEQADTRAEEGELELIFPDPATASHRRPAVTAALATVPGVVGRVEPRRSAVAAAVERSSRRLEVAATAATEARARRLAERLAARLGDAAGDDAVAVAGDADFRRGRPALGVRWDRPRLARLDADAGVLAAQLRAGLGDFHAGRAAIEGAEPEILLAATEPADPELLPVRPAVNGGAAPRVVPLAAVAALEPRRLAPPLERSDGRPAVRVAVDRDRLAAAGVSPARLAALLAEVPRGADEELRPVGWSFEMARSFTQLRLALALALVLVFLTVAALYESLAVPVVVMTTVPVAAAGALLALFAGGQSLNVMSFLGVVLLAGIVVNNAIVLVHRAEELRGESDGGHLGDALLAAAGERYRPILITTLTTLLGMVPLALLGGEGVELRRALAVAVIGGLVTSFFAALFLVPVLHRALTGRRGGG